jgi:hypothetical protein
MSCSCGRNCRPGCGCRIVVLPSNPVQQWNFESIGMIGTPMLAGVDGMNVQFFTVASGNTSLVVTLDAGNGAVLFTLNIGQIVSDIPDASEVQRGVLETATTAEALGKAAINKILVPSNLAALGASQTFAGLVELATSAETQAGISSTLAVTPAGLASVVATLSTPTVWADAAARAGDAPAFVGQIGVQQNTLIAWIGSGTSAGDFDVPVMTLDNTNNVMTNATAINLGGQTLTFGLGDFSFFGGIATFTDGIFRLGGSGTTDVDFNAGANLQIGGVTMPLQTLLGTSSAGTPNAWPIASFLSSLNTQTGYTPVTNGAVRRTFDCNTVTLPELAQAWGTLVEDLKAALLPAT